MSTGYLRKQLDKALGPDWTERLKARLAELNAMTPQPGASNRPGILLNGEFRSDREAKQAWMRERNGRKPQRLRGCTWKPSLRPQEPAGAISRPREAA